MRIPKFVVLYLSLIASMLIGRLVYAGILLFSGFIAIQKAPAAATVFSSFLVGLPGVIIQLALIPVIAVALQKVLRMPNAKEMKAS